VGPSAHGLPGGTGLTRLRFEKGQRKRLARRGCANQAAAASKRRRPERQRQEGASWPTRNQGVGQATPPEAASKLVAVAQTALRRGDVGGARSVLDRWQTSLNRLRAQRGR
jgi:hypothetical protein